MRSVIARGLLLLVLQCIIVSSLAAKYAHDRATCPRVWVKTAYYDPELPIRGRYAALQLELKAPGVFQERPLVVDNRATNPNPQQKTPCEQNGSQVQQKTHYVTVWDSKPVRLEIRNGQLVGVSDDPSSLEANYSRDSDGNARITLRDQIDFFVPEHAANVPQWQWPRGSHIEWWAEVTLPKKGPPRPIRLGIMQPDGHIMPLPTA
jgi:hypothetical protein